MPKPRTGTLIYRADEKRWKGALTVGDGQRRFVYGKTEEEARVKMLALDPTLAPKPWAPTKIAGIRTGRQAIIMALLDRARTHKWSDRRLAEVLSGSLTPSRIRWRISGPCAYCGDEMASTVDHQIPLSRGGLDGPPNVVSCCTSCNIGKGKRTLEEWPH
jgi:hypothetical protein